jgi:hypothetical protein
METHTLISQLSSEVTVSRPLRPPTYWALWLFAALVIYGIAAQFFLGLRPDLMLKFFHPAFTAELLLLAMITITSSYSAILAMYPDAAGRKLLLRLPYVSLVLFTCLMVSQILMQNNALTHVFTSNIAGMACTLCIAAITILPSALLFWIQRKGASVLPLQAGAMAVLAASALGCIALRLHEPTEDVLHLIVAHYLPTILFALIGAQIGKWALKW